MSSPVSPPDLSSLSISSQLDQPNSNSAFNNDHNNGGHGPTFFSTAPPGSAPFAQNNAYGTKQQASSYEQAHFNNTIASMGSKARGGLPSHWLDQPQADGGAGSGRSLSPPTDLSSSGSPPPGAYGQPMNSGLGVPSPGGGTAMSVGGGDDDDIIPTAIVIKNIPFSVKRETLLEIIASLSIPTPYAFNYHVDGAGAFRGLAFANFRLPQDADAVVAALNGFDVQGRKLRVEYKKVLQAGEKERIEREKAIRRMRSMQMEKERQAAAVGGGGGGGAGIGEWEDYGQPLASSQYGMGGGMPPSPARGYSNGQLAPHQMAQNNPPPVPQMPAQYYGMQQQQRQQSTPIVQVTTPPPIDVGSLDQYHHQQHQQRSFSPSAISTSNSPPPMGGQRGYSQHEMQQQSMVMPEPSVPQPRAQAELDMNDPSTLEIYSRILLFKDDRMRDELAFSKSLTALERRVVHMVAKKLGLYHRSVGEGSERFAVVMRFPPDGTRPAPARQQSQHTLSRAQSSYLSASTGPSAAPSPSRGTSTSLRAKKSMPDLSTLHAPQARLGNRASNGNIREYATVSGSRRPQHASFNGLFGNNGDAPPPVPTLPPNLDGPHNNHNGSYASAALSQSTSPGGVVRQPRGPTGDGFGSRRGVGNDLAAGSGSMRGFGASTNTAPSKSVVNELGGLDTRTHEPFEV